MNSFGLLRTNVGLTTNIKIMVDSNYNLSLDSIDSKSDLSISKLKKVQFNKKNYWDELIKYFYDGIPASTAYYIKYDEDEEIMNSNFSSQYDEIYQYGARNISNNKNYSEEFEYFAPLWIEKGNLPKYFVIFRVDGPGLISLNKNNFREEILKKMKFVKMFDLTTKSNLGEWFDINFSNKNKFFPDSPLEMDFRSLEFCRWNGINFENGGYISNSLFIDDIIDEEKEIFELEKFIFDKFRDLKVVVANILNFSFLFDDEPSTPEFKRKWSINRYLGFYIEEMELVKTLSPYIPPFIKPGVVVGYGNILTTSNDSDPFVEGWSDKKPFYVEYNGQYYKIEKITQNIGTRLIKTPPFVMDDEFLSNMVDSPEPSRSMPSSATTTPLMPSRNAPASTGFKKAFNNPRYEVEDLKEVSVVRYKIISDLDLRGKESYLNKNSGYINKSGTLMDYDNNPLMIDGFDNADVWIIEINGIYHKLNNLSGYLKIISDYSFDYGVNSYEYKVAGVSTTVNTIVDFDNPPKKWSIFRLKFSDIKDFDDRIIDTEFSKYEYEKKEELTKTDESKLYLSDLNSSSNPPSLDDFVYKGNVVNIPVSSEYTANHETFKIENGKLTNLWRKNAEHCRWCYQNSLSSNDYPYLLNNSMIMEDFNKTTNTYESDPKRIERNLDYFYTLNIGTSSYIHHSLHVCSYTGSNIDSSFKFELPKYLGSYTYSVGSSSVVKNYNFDYFSNIFDRKVIFDSGKIVKNSKKYSTFNIGENRIPNITLFKGIKFFIYDIESIKKSETGDLNINVKNSNNFENYKFSILLSDNDWSVNNQGRVVKSENLMDWSLIDEWKMDTNYPVGGIGIFDDVLYISKIENVINYPVVNIGSRQIKSAPHLFIEGTSEWGYLNMTYSIFWNPLREYNTQSGSFYKYVAFNDGEYYKYNNSGTEDFWNPMRASSTGYNINEIVLYKNQYYKSTVNENSVSPDYITEHVKPVYQNSNDNLSADEFFTFKIPQNEEADSVNFNVNTPTWQKFWIPVEPTNPKWTPVELWNPTFKYRASIDDYKLVVHNDILYRTTTLVSAEEEPGISKKWERLYSFVPDTNFIYKNTSNGNPIIKMNNKYYLINSNNSNSTLDNGVVIYINKKWKNILVNINIADNTVSNISNSERDLLYKDINKKLTANNFILAINDMRNKYGFTDYVTYVIIDESGKIKKYNYNLNITTLPHLIVCETSEDLDVKANSLTIKPVQLTGDLNAKKVLNSGVINNLNELNYYNNISVGSIIQENKFEPKIFENYHGNKNIIKNKIYRFTGNYMPLFYNIDLFQKNWEMENTGNYKFDTSLTSFGIMKERRISKVNRNGSILKLKDSKSNRSIYPMLDEFGYTIDDFFIFSSTWDTGYHLETSLNEVISRDLKPFTRYEIRTFETEFEEIKIDRNNLNLNPVPFDMEENNSIVEDPLSGIGPPSVNSSLLDEEVDFNKLPNRRISK